MLISWQALATVFAAMPALAAVTYLYDSGKTGKRPTFRGYFQLLLFLRKAKQKAYEQTADVVGANSGPVAKRVLVWTIVLVLAAVGSDYVFAAGTYAFCVVALPFSYRLGKKHRIMD